MSGPSSMEREAPRSTIQDAQADVADRIRTTFPHYQGPLLNALRPLMVRARRDVAREGVDRSSPEYQLRVLDRALQLARGEDPTFTPNFGTDFRPVLPGTSGYSGFQGRLIHIIGQARDERAAAVSRQQP